MQRRFVLLLLCVCLVSRVCLSAEPPAPESLKLVRSVQSGAWSDAATWDRDEIPGHGVQVQVRSRHTATYDVQAPGMNKESCPAIINLGGGPRPQPQCAKGVPITLHDWFGPGRHAVDVGSLNRVPSGPREQRHAGGIPARGAMPTRLNERAILNSARYRPTHVWPQSLLPGYQKAPPFDEQVSWSRLDCGVRVFVNAPATQTARPRVLIVYATPNGNTIEQTLGCAASKELDWRFDIQHVAAQIRRLRDIDAKHEFVLAIVQAPKLSWPTFRREQSGANTIIRDLVEKLTKEVSAERTVLTCHSGGGSFIFGFMNAFESLPPSLDRIVFLDANYSYSDDERHGEKLLEWLKGDAVRRLVVIAYDDREITLNARKVVGPDGGTFRASQRMLNRLRRDVDLTEQDVGPFRQTTGLNGQIQFYVHPNPDNRILHTALVGEMNGLLQGLTLGTDVADKWGQFGEPRAYTKLIQRLPFVDPTAVPATIPADVPEVRIAFPDRAADALSGSAFHRQITDLPRDQREEALLREIMTGNVPEFLRRLKPIRVEATDDTGTRHVAVYFVMPDYLAIGSDDDFFRVPITPATATVVVDKFDASLITARVSDDIFAAAQVKLDPKPMTKDRDAVATFWQHHQIIEEQLRGKPRGLLVAGIKKDVVLTNRLKEKPHKVAIYGWHESNGQPIQSLYVGHVEWYVDYSQGVRLMSQQIIVDHQPMKVSDVLKDAHLCPLLSTEGPIDVAEVRNAAGWGR